MSCLNAFRTPEEQLFVASKTNDIALAKSALSHQNVVAIADENHDTPVHVAVRHGAMDVLQFLLKHPVNLTYCNHRGNAPIHEAAMLGSLEAAKMILRARRMGTKGAADPNQMQGLRLEYKRKSLLKRVLLSIIDFTPAWRTGPEHLPLKTKGWTPLHIAAYHNDAHMAEELIQFGADCNRGNQFGRTPLHIAAHSGHVEVALLFLMHGADPNVQDSLGDTPVHDAVYQDRYELTQLLLCFGGSNKIVNSLGKVPSACSPNLTMINVVTRPLHVAVASGQIKLVEGLLEHGAIVNDAGVMGETPLHLAAAHGDVEIAQMLLDHDADVNAVDGDYNTPLHYAAGMGQVEMTELLLRHGAMPDLMNMARRLLQDEKIPKQLVPVARNRGSDGHASGRHRIVVENDAVLKIAQKVSTEPGVISADQWHELHARLPTRESTRYSIRGMSFSKRVAPPPEASATIDTMDDKSRKSLRRTKSARIAAEAAAKEQALREQELQKEHSRLERAAALSDALRHHMQRLRPWGRVIPPPELQEEAISAALDEVDGPGAGYAHRMAAYEEFLQHRKEKQLLKHKRGKKGDGHPDDADEVGSGGAKRRIAPMDL